MTVDAAPGVAPDQLRPVEEPAAMLRTDDLDYLLPPERVATHPTEPRDAARLLVVSRSDESRLEDRCIRDLPEVLHRGDLLVMNASRVVPARLVGNRVGTGGKVEGLFLSELPATPGDNRRRWAVMMRGRHLRAGAKIAFRPSSVVAQAPDALRPDLHAELAAPIESEPGAWVLVVESLRPTIDLLAAYGRTPLPPYILKARAAAGDVDDSASDRERYQTVYALQAADVRSESASDSSAGGGPGGEIGAHASVAAPTAGLHFTPDLLARLEAMGCRRELLELHVGTGTFRPVETEFVEQHPMHSELCSMPALTRQAIAEARAQGRRVIAVGTTSARTIESFASLPPNAEHASTRLLIVPGYRWQWTDSLLTNFHLPRSTLLAMVAALFPGGIDRVRALYEYAIARGYRFYSYGDAMLILP